MSNFGFKNGLRSLSRRPFLKGMWSASVLNAIPKPVADRFGAKLGGWTFNQDAPDFIEYHDVSSDFHKRKTEELPAQGYRLISLSLYDYPYTSGWLGYFIKPRYAGVWVRGSGPPQQFVQDVDESGFQAQFDALALAGFKPTVLAATTSFFRQSFFNSYTRHRFAAVFEKTAGPIPLTRYHLVSGDASDSRTIQHWMEQARCNRWKPTTLTVYGTPLLPLFAGVWEPDPAAIAWSADGLMETSAEYQQRFDAQVTAWNRPAYITVSPSGRYLSLFQDDQVGPWITRLNMAKADFERQKDQFIKEGFFPLVLQAGGVGSSVRYAAIFTKRAKPVERHFMLKDSEDIQNNEIDDVIRNMMSANGVRQAALAVINGTKLLFARGYTLAEPGYPLATATTYFRVASCSKILTVLAVLRLAQDGRLGLDDRIQARLHLTTPNGQAPIDPRFNNVTIRQALTRFSGLRGKWDDGLQVVRAFDVDGRLPATKLQIARYAIGQPRLFESEPGQPRPDNRLSDFGYLLVSLVIERVSGASGEPFAQLVRDIVGRPLGATRIRSGTNLVLEQPSDEARYHDDRLTLGRSVTSNDQPLVPFQYGVDNFPILSGAGGLSVAAVDFARVLAALNLSNNNPLLNQNWINTMLAEFIGWDFYGGINRFGNFHRSKGGLLEGLQSTVNFTQHQISYVIYWARDDVRGKAPAECMPPDFQVLNGPLWEPEFPALQDAIQDAIRRNLAPMTRDRFPDYGMPSF